jgi:hypothetical protein
MHRLFRPANTGRPEPARRVISDKMPTAIKNPQPASKEFTMMVTTSGDRLAGRRRQRLPLLSDRGLLILMAAMLIGVAASTSTRWTIGVSVAIGAAGVLVTLLRDQQ